MPFQGPHTPDNERPGVVDGGGKRGHVAEHALRRPGRVGCAVARMRRMPASVQRCRAAHLQGETD